jgi:ubiquinone/menaquinone biosynthesis C-methylase UbiE
MSKNLQITNQPAQKVKKPYHGIAMEGMIARWYNKSTRNRGDYQLAANRIAQEMPKGSQLLEVAPGPGFLSIELAKLGLYQVTALDISKTFVELARENAREAGVSVDFRHGDVAGMPFEDESFDFITCHAAFKNFPLPVQALKEMYRVLKPGGKASIVDLRPDVSEEAIDAEVKNMKLGAINAFFTKWTFKQALIKAAHTREEIQSYVSQTKFGKCDILESPIGFEIRLEK